MSKEITRINNALKVIDVTKLAIYTNKIKDIGSLSKPQASFFMQDFISAIDLTNLMLLSAVKLDLDAKTALLHAEAVAYLDLAPDYLKEKGVKESDGAKKMYININEDVMAAKEVKAKTEAVVIFLKNKIQVFRNCHDDVKKIGYADQNMTNFEGY